MLAPSQQATNAWPIAGDVPDLLAIVQAQARTITDQEALLHAYQGVLNSAQIPVASASCTGSGTALTVGTVTNGPILIGSVVAGTGVPVGTTITAQTAGTTGAAGTYTTSVATTATSNNLTFTPSGAAMPWPPGVVQDQTDLMAIQQAQTTVLRQQSALLQGYQDLLNASETPPPSSGP